MWADNSPWDDFLAKVEAHRHEIDEANLLRKINKNRPRTQDLRIASIAQSRGATLVARNQRLCGGLGSN